MKIVIKITMMAFVAMFFLVFTGCSSAKKTASSKPGQSAPAMKEVAKAPIYVGTWAFVVKGTPDGDSMGDMVITEEGKVLKGIVSVAGGQTDIQNLVITNNVLSGIFSYNGMSINMSGTFTEITYEGKVEAQGYAFPMTATKK
jgi:hypothetical protein